jgi:hypothetical protein
MPVEKISVSLSEDVAARARRAAANAGVPLSTWLSHAAQEAADLAEAQAALDEYVDRYGEPTADVTAAAEADLLAAGVGQYETPAEAAERHAALARLRGESTNHGGRKAG